MDFAALQLQMTDLSIEEIGRSTGIQNPSHFYRLFRKRHDDTPRRFRERRRLDPVQPLKLAELGTDLLHGTGLFHPKLPWRFSAKR